MNETANNRRWLVRSQLDRRSAHRAVGRPSDVDTLLYYRKQLATELAEVDTQLSELTRQSA